MARIAGIDIPENKQVEVSLTYIYGIGRSSAQKILEAAQVNAATRVGDLTQQELSRIRQIIDEHYQVEGERRRVVSQNIKRLMDIGCYRGIRHQKGLPVRGQRTRSNARTKRGGRKTVGGLKRVLAKT